MKIKIVHVGSGTRRQRDSGQLASGWVASVRIQFCHDLPCEVERVSVYGPEFGGRGTEGVLCTYVQSEAQVNLSALGINCLCPGSL